jgi:hypothetical protein
VQLTKSPIPKARIRQFSSCPQQQAQQGNEEKVTLARLRKWNFSIDGARPSETHQIHNSMATESI